MYVVRANNNQASIPRSYLHARTAELVLRSHSTKLAVLRWFIYITPPYVCPCTARASGKREHPSSGAD